MPLNVMPGEIIDVDGWPHVVTQISLTGMNRMESEPAATYLSRNLRIDDWILYDLLIHEGWKPPNE